MDKEAIRLLYRSKRRELTKEQIRSYSAEITERFLGFLDQNKSIRHIHIFLPIDKFHEVDTFPLFYTLQERGYNLYTSQVNKIEDQLDTLNITDIKGFESDDWGIPLPVDGKLSMSDDIQLVLIPLLAYDIRGFRIGYGKGYYDKFLASLPQKVLKVGLSFFPPEPQIPFEPHDIPMDFCVLPTNVFFFSGKNINSFQ